MDLTPLMHDNSQVIINGYGPGYFIVGKTKVSSHLLLTNKQFWQIEEFTATEIGDLLLKEAAFKAQNPIIVIGYDAKKHDPLLISSQYHNVGIEPALPLELTSNKTACSTFNMLCLENRPVIALIARI